MKNMPPKDYRAMPDYLEGLRRDNALHIMKRCVDPDCKRCLQDAEKLDDLRQQIQNSGDC